MENTTNATMPDQQALLNIFREHGRPMRVETVQSLASIRRRDKKELNRILREMAVGHLLDRLPGGFYALPENAVCVSGEFVGFPNGGGLVRVAEPVGLAGLEVLIPSRETNGALPKDNVRAVLLSGRVGGRGKILEIVERGQESIPAILEEKHKRSLVFHAADGRMGAIFYARSRPDRDAEAELGDLALLKIKGYKGNSHWQAEILAWFGPFDSIAAQEETVKRSRNAPCGFSALALEQAASLPAQPDAAEMEGREDLRHMDFVTIDGADARDFDDAIHVERTEDGYLLRVAIADVSHYVRPDERPGSLDQEARSRGNSWYFPRSCEPMLPRALCNGLCSLRPGEDRLAMLVEMPFSKSGAPFAPRFAPIVMRSRARLIYDDAARFFAGDADAVPDASLRPMLETAHELYAILARKRRQRGTLDFEMPEPAYEFAADGRLASMRVAARTDAHRLIEEFMIAANEAVAGYLGGKGIEFLYRIHPAPEPGKLQKLLETLKLIASNILPANLLKAQTMAPGDIQEVLVKAAGAPQEYVVNRLCLRSMGQARYQPQNIGHFGLASPAYCHFTSPIRRYADLLAHRALKVALGRQDIPLPDAEQLDGIGDELNGLERRAAECEREMAKRMACLALRGREGQEFAGVISGLTDFGVFVELADLPVDGIMRMEDLGCEWLEVDQARQLVMCQRSGRIWRLGQKLEVALFSVNVERQEIRLKPLGSAEGSWDGGPGCGAGRGPRGQRHGNKARFGKTRRSPKHVAPKKAASAKPGKLKRREPRRRKSAGRRKGVD